MADTSLNGRPRVTKPARSVTNASASPKHSGAVPHHQTLHRSPRRIPTWLLLVPWFVAASAAFVVDGALFGEPSQLLAVAIIAAISPAVIALRWDAVWQILRTRLGLLALLNGIVLVVSALFSVYHWASVREILKAVALAEVFMVAAVTVDRDALRDRWLWVLYWWSITAVAAGIILYAVAVRWPQSMVGIFGIRAQVMFGTRLGAFFGYANALAAFLLVPISLGVAAAWSGGRKGITALVGLIVPLVALQLTSSRGGFLVLAVVMAVMIGIGARMRQSTGVTPVRKAAIAAGTLLVAMVLVLAPPLTLSPAAPQVGQRFASIGAEVRNTDAETSSIGGRIAMIRDSVRYAAAYPVLGSGPGTYASAYFRFRSTNFFSSDPHSQAMLMLTETGIIGFVLQMLLLAAVLGLLWRAAIRDAQRSLLLVGIAAGITGVVLHAMADWDFQSWFLPLLIAACGGMAVRVGAANPPWLLLPARGVTAHVGATPTGKGRRLALVGLVVVMVASVLAVAAAQVAQRAVGLSSTNSAVAARRLEVAQRLNPLDADYPFLRARVYASQLQGVTNEGTDKAIRDAFAHAVALNPYYIEYQIEQGKYLLGQMDPACVAVYENLTRIDPGDPGTFTSLGWAYHLMYRNDEKALASIDTALAIDGEYYEAWMVLGRIREASGDTASAIKAYWKAAQVNPADPSPLGRLGNLYEQAGNSAGTARVAWELLRQTPDSETAKTTFQSLGMDLRLVAVQLTGRQLSASWTIGGKDAAESYNLALVRPDGTEILLAEGIDATQREADVTIPASVQAGTYRLRLYAMAPRALEALDTLWVSWAVSADLDIPAN
jgi:O-antigen ligase/tetratricopeptide (TPR) repeat protein